MFTPLRAPIFDPLKTLFGHMAKIPIQHRSLTRSFTRKVGIEFERKNYKVKTIETEDELEAVLGLRYEVFHREFQKKFLPYGVDWEALDPIADHLVIIDKTQDRIVGTYRLIASTFSQNFYSQSEFNIEALLDAPGTKLELSRACIHKDYRNGAVMGLLWRGLTRYFASIQAEYLFGCASVKTMDHKTVEEMSAKLEARGTALKEFSILPTSQYGRRGGLQLLSRKGEEQLPPLLQAYLHAGARASLVPAWDYDFRCVDYFTVLKVSEMDASFQRKYRE